MAEHKELLTAIEAGDGDRAETVMREHVESARAGSARDVVDAIVEATTAFQGDMPAADDVTLVAVRRRPRTARGGRSAANAV